MAITGIRTATGVMDGRRYVNIAVAVENGNGTHGIRHYAINRVF
jgi:hypothetical protein